MYKFFISSVILLFSQVCWAQESQIFQTILDPLHYTQVYPEVFSRVVEIPKKLGDSFQKGQLLLKMDNDHFKANLLKAQKAAEKGEADLEVKGELFQQHLLSKLELKEAESFLANAQAEVALAKLTIERSEIRAGYNGKIANVSIRLYEYPIENKPMLAYLNDESIIAKFLVPAALVNQINLGQIVYILIVDTNEIVQARVIRIAPDVNPTSGTVKLEAEFANPDERWRSGMASYASFNRKALLEQFPLAVVLPETEHERMQPEKMHPTMHPTREKK